MIYIGQDDYGTFDVADHGFQYTYFGIPERMRMCIKKLIKAGAHGKAWCLLKKFDCHKREVR